MVTTEVFDKLKELQDVLAEKYSLEAKIEDSPKQLSSQDELLVRLRKEFLETNDSYEKVKAEVGQLQLELDEAEKSREAGEKGRKYQTVVRFCLRIFERTGLCPIFHAPFRT